jgi:death on curing protein
MQLNVKKCGSSLSVIVMRYSWRNHCRVWCDAEVLNEGALDSTANKPKNFYHYNDAATLYELSAALGYGLAKNHCFIDGNKRIALIATYTFLSINSYEMTASEVEATRFFIEIAASQDSQDSDVDKLKEWLSSNLV